MPLPRRDRRGPDLVIAPSTLWVFAGLSTALLVAPGPAVTFVVARSLSNGPRAGIVTQAGLCAGLLVHVVAAAVGVSAVVARSAATLATLRLLGALYLLWLGIRCFTSSEPQASALEKETEAPRTLRLFRDGFVVDALNPKPALFFLAALPPFVDPSAGPVGVQVAILGGLFVALAFVTGCGFAGVAGLAAPILHRTGPSSRWTRRATGSIYVALAGAVALADR